ncbi:NAD(P)-dependent oxidoreductase, partial [Chloroflexota bacterium]
FFDEDGKPIGTASKVKALDEINLEYEVFPEFLPEVTPEHIRGFDMVISFIPKWTSRTLAGNSQLLAVNRGGVGYDMVDVPALTNAGVMLTIVPPAVRRPVAVSIITFLLALSTRLFAQDRLTREGRWADRARYHGIGLIGKTLGSVGVGNIGHEMFALAKPFGMKHIAYDPYITQESVADVEVKLIDLNTVLSESDFLNISCPLNEKTRHIIGGKELRKMKKTAFLINTARGPIVDEAALVKALQGGWIQGAGLDVLEQEPTPPDNPLLKMDNVIVTPHAMCMTDQYFAASWAQIVKQISQIICGETPENLVNPEVWDKTEFQSKLKRFRESLK